MSGAEFLTTPPRRPRFFLRSLTARLVVMVVSLVILLVGAIGGCTFYFLRSYLLSRLDQQVTVAAAQNFGPIDHCVDTAVATGQPRIQCFGGTPLGVHEWIAVLSPNGDVRGELSSSGVSPLTLSAKQRASLSDNPNQILTVYSGTQKLRVTGQTSGPFTNIVVTGLSTSEVDHTMHRLIRLEILIGGAAVLIAFAATSLGVQRSLRNLYRVTNTAQEVTAELSPEGAGLDRRVPVVEEGTEVGQLAESMNTLLAAVETQFKARLESEQLMRQFLADASHELRTPLTSIRGYAELARMQRSLPRDSQAGDHDNLDRIESEGTRMSRLVDDLLLLARGDSNGATHIAERMPVDLADVLDDAVHGSRAAYPDRRVDLSVDGLPAVMGDRDQLLRAVRNLITNSAEHTAPGRPILVRGFADAGGAVVTVADGGPGLPPEQAAHVFERFWRADKARTRARGGTGLGLSIVAAIVRAHGGSVRFDSDVERGSTVTVWLPGMTE